MTDVAIETADPTAPLELGALPGHAEAERHSFVARTEAEWRQGVNRFDRPGEGLFVARTSDEIIGMCGLNIDPFIADPTVGRLRHLYVHPDHRGRGVGRDLVAVCLALAQESFSRVRLRTFDPVASAFYVAVGFEAADEPDATHTVTVVH